MKTFLTAVLIATATLTMQAQNHKIEVKTNPIGFAFGVSNLSAEMPLPANPTVTMNLSAWHVSKNMREWTDVPMIGGASFGVRKYVLASDDRGLFLGTATRAVARQDYTYTWNGTENVYTYVDDGHISLGFTLGYKLVFNRITLDAFTGIGRKLITQQEGTFPAEYMGGFNFGYRF